MSRSGHLTTAEEEMRLEGFWWLTSQPEKKVAGTLIILPFDTMRLDLARSPKLSQRQRLRELLNDVDDVMSQLIRKKEKFISRVVHTRNYYTHTVQEIV